MTREAKADVPTRKRPWRSPTETLGPPRFVSFSCHVDGRLIVHLKWMRPVLDENGNWTSWVNP